MTRALDPILGQLRERLLQMGARSEAIIDKSMRALQGRDARLAAQVVEDDLEIDRLDVAIDGGVLEALALRAPVAGDLREVVAIKMIATDLERVGDLARNIAKSAERLAARTEARLPDGLDELSSLARDLLGRALDAYTRCDPDAARAVMADDDRVDRAQDEVVLLGLREIAEEPARAPQAVDYILVAKNLERVGDHATNIAEDVILIAEARNVKHAQKLEGAPSRLAVIDGGGG